MSRQTLKSIYDRQYVYGRYRRSAKDRPSEHSHQKQVEEFVEAYGLNDMKCLEVACGRGAFQGVVRDYTGVDISEAAGRSLQKPFVNASATSLPFSSSSFDAIWSIATLEHVYQPVGALVEMRRVLKSGGLLFLAPAWFCRSWAAEGYAVRPYSAFKLKGKLIKASIPIRNSLVYRLPGVLVKRTWRLMAWERANRRETRFCYKELKPDYENNWTSDSDAVASIDPFEVILWFISRGDHCLNYPSLLSAFRVRTGPLVFVIRK